MGMELSKSSSVDASKNSGDVPANNGLNPLFLDFARSIQKSLETLPKAEKLSDGSLKLTDKKTNGLVKLDAEKRVTQIIDALGQSTSFVYDENGQIKEMTDKEGTFYTRDGMNWHKAGKALTDTPDRIGAVKISDSFSIVRSSVGGSSCVHKNLDGTTTLCNKNGEKSQFDHKGNLLKFIDSKNKQTDFHYDAAGKYNGETIINPDGSRIKFNSLGRISDLTDTRGKTTSLKYDANGTINEISDHRGTNKLNSSNFWLPAKPGSGNFPFTRGQLTVKEDGTLIEYDQDHSTVTATTLSGKKKIFELPDVLHKFKDISERVFKEIDTDKNNYLSADELGKAVQNAKFTGNEAQVIAALHKHRQTIANLSNDEYGAETSGITRSDIERIDFLQRNQKEISHSAAWLGKDDRFKKIDKNNNEFLSRNELAEAMDPYDDANMKSLTFLFNNFELVENENDDEIGVENDGVTSKDMKSLAEEATLLDKISFLMHRTSQTQNPDLTDGLYSSSIIKDSITPEAVVQGKIGNCYFEAALASLAASRPESIKKMIRDNNDDTYTVTFPGDTKHPVTVKAPTEAEMGIFNHKSSYGTWACVLEKAYGQYKLDLNKGKDNEKNPVFTPTEGADGGGYDKDTIALLTGKQCARDKLGNVTEADIRNHVTTALQQKRVVTCSSNNDRRLQIGAQLTPGGYHTHHSLSVTDFNPAGPDGGTVTVRNPWGHKENTARGTMQLSWRKFMENFNQFDYEQP